MRWISKRLRDRSTVWIVETGAGVVVVRLCGVEMGKWWDGVWILARGEQVGLGS